MSLTGFWNFLRLVLFSFRLREPLPFSPGRNVSIGKKSQGGRQRDTESGAGRGCEGGTPALSATHCHSGAT